MDGSASAPAPPRRWRVQSALRHRGCIPAVISSRESWQLGWRMHIKPAVVAEGAQRSLPGMEEWGSNVAACLGLEGPAAVVLVFSGSSQV